MLETTEQLFQALAIIAIAVIAVFIGAQQLIKSWKGTQAESDIIQIMHRELERMGDQNTKLSLELGRLHDQIIALNQELEKLTLENQRLQVEVVALTNEVSVFKRIAKDAQGVLHAATS